MRHHFKWDSQGRGGRCGHQHCSGCKTRRGRNRGNRRQRYAARAELRSAAKEA